MVGLHFGHLKKPHLVILLPAQARFNFLSAAFYIIMYISIRVTRCVCEKVAQNVAQSISCENYYITCGVEKSSPVFGATSESFTKTTQSKQSPVERIFSQSGHPDFYVLDGRFLQDPSCKVFFLSYLFFSCDYANPIQIENIPMMRPAIQKVPTQGKQRSCDS
jgi:hypothetical protein